MPLLDRPRQRSGRSPAHVADRTPSAIEPCTRDAKAARDGAPIPEPSPPACSTSPRQPKPGATIPIGRARPTAEPHLPAVSSPEASPTPAARAPGQLPAAAGVREPLTGADETRHRQECPVLMVKRTAVSNRPRPERISCEIHHAALAIRLKTAMISSLERRAPVCRYSMASSAASWRSSFEPPQQSSTSRA